MENVFLVSQDIFPPTQVQPNAFANKTAELADVFLPSAFWIEKGGVFGNTERRSCYTEKAIDAPGDLKADWEIIVEVARRMGFGERFKYRTTCDLWDEYRQACRDHRL